MTTNVKPKWILLLLLLFSSHNLYAALGMPLNTSRYAVSYGPAEIEVNDPDGKTNYNNSNNVLALAYSDWFYLDTRYWLEWQQFSVDMEASEDQVGQYIQHQALSISLQKQLPLHRHFKPWMNVGAQLSHSQYSLRHTVTHDGFLQKRFDDREEFKLGLVVASQVNWDLRRNWGVGFRAQQSLVPGNGVSYRSLNLLILYQP